MNLFNALKFQQDGILVAYQNKKFHGFLARTLRKNAHNLDNQLSITINLVSWPGSTAEWPDVFLIYNLTSIYLFIIHNSLSSII